VNNIRHADNQHQGRVKGAHDVERYVQQAQKLKEQDHPEHHCHHRNQHAQRSPENQVQNDQQHNVAGHHVENNLLLDLFHKIDLADGTACIPHIMEVVVLDQLFGVLDKPVSRILRQLWLCFDQHGQSLSIIRDQVIRPSGVLVDLGTVAAVTLRLIQVDQRYA